LEAFDGKNHLFQAHFWPFFTECLYSERIVMFSPLTLLRLHVEAVWYVRLTHDFELVRDGVQPPWKLLVAEVAGERVSIWRPDIAQPEREALRLRIDEALSPQHASQPDIHREVALVQTATPHITLDASQRIARHLEPSEHALLHLFYPDAPDDDFQPEQEPFVGVLHAERLLCLAHSSRRTTEACELGIETHAQARRRGFALAATLVWTDLVRREGLLPLYSALATNTASLHLAEAAGYRPFACVATIS
jgi:RimJ/RimL family protein N-acetyltransferase